MRARYVMGFGASNLDFKTHHSRVCRRFMSLCLSGMFLLSFFFTAVVGALALSTDVQRAQEFVLDIFVAQLADRGNVSSIIEGVP